MFDVLFKFVFNPVTKKRSQFVLLELCFRFFEKVRLFLFCFVFNSLGFVLFDLRKDQNFVVCSGGNYLCTVF